MKRIVAFLRQETIVRVALAVLGAMIGCVLVVWLSGALQGILEGDQPPTLTPGGRS